LAGNLFTSVTPGRAWSRSIKVSFDQRASLANNPPGWESMYITVKTATTLEKQGFRFITEYSRVII
ncbi:MAG: hypothetical protein PHV91_02820, partial [Bacteroidales bacterium]|nr:hypothetical protein [Bacteroidales bacterium]